MLRTGLYPPSDKDFTSIIDLIESGQEITDEAIMDLVNRLETRGDNLDASIERFGKWIKEIELTAEVPKKEADRLRKRAQNYEELAERLRDALKSFMLKTGKYRVKSPLITLTIKPGQPSVISADPLVVGEDFLKPIPPREVDKKKILDSFKENGQVPPGVLLDTNKKFLEIR